MPRHIRNGHDNSPAPDTEGYKFASSVFQENVSVETYGVQFCLKPSADQLKGGGVTWRRPRSPTTGEFEEENPSQAGPSSQLTMSNGTIEDDCEICPVPLSNQIASWRDIFVTCTGVSIRVYEAKKKSIPTLLQEYVDEDLEEIFYSVAVTYNADNTHQWWVCAAGKQGVIRVINMQKGCVIKTLTGHGEAINDLKIHPRDSALVLTASKDESLRLWNIRTGVTVAIFAGLKGHRGEVLFVDFDATGRRFASCGIDNSIRIWDVDADTKLVEAIVESHEAANLGGDESYRYEDKEGGKKKLELRTTQFPYFVTTKLHHHYVDCVMWVGDLLVSKSVHNRMLLWEPGFDREVIASPTNNYNILEEYVLEGCKVWFIRFGMDRRRRLLACGNDKGIVTVFDLTKIPPKPLCEVSSKDLKTKFIKKSSCVVRQCAFSEDGTFLVAVDEHSNIVQYERH